MFRLLRLHHRIKELLSLKIGQIHQSTWVLVSTFLIERLAEVIPWQRMKDGFRKKLKDLHQRPGVANAEGLSISVLPLPRKV